MPNQKKHFPVQSSAKPSGKSGKKSGSSMESKRNHAVKTKKPAAPKLPAGWMVFAKELMDVRALMSAFPADRDIEIWPQAGVLELALGEKESLTIETMEIPTDPENAAWFAENGVKSLFYLTFDAEGYEQALKDMQLLADALDLQICGDTDDLTPVIEKK